jgi:ElaB/YqjD/DUF883 family membrane-anchored ribosome-binding protein
MANALVEEITDDISATIKRALDRLSFEARSASGLTSAIAHEAASKARKRVEFARGVMRDHSARNIAIGVGVGVLATVLLTRGPHRKH